MSQNLSSAAVVIDALRVKNGITLHIITQGPGQTLCMLGNFSCFCCRLLTFFKINFFKKFFQKHISVKWLGYRTELNFCQSLSGSKLIAKIISRRPKSPLARKGLMGERGASSKRWLDIL